MKGNRAVLDTVLISMGSNTGDRATYLRNALDALGALSGVTVKKVSHGYETEPWGMVDQPDFLNLGVEIETELAPLEFLNATKAIEVRLEREPGPKWGPRTVDIDIVLWGDVVLEHERLRIPHRDFRKRAFVLAPLAEIAGTAQDPETGLTIAELLEQPDVTGRIKRTDLLDH